MNSKIVSVIMSGLLSLGLVACSNNQDLEQVPKEKQNIEISKEEKTCLTKLSEGEEDIQEKKEDEKKVVEPVEDEVEEKTTKENVYVCDYCGGTDCPPDSECNLLVECIACYEFGVIGEDITVWTNSEGATMLTHTGECTEAMQLEDEVHRTKNYTCSTCGKTVQSNDVEWMGECEDCIYNYNCEYCQDTGILPGGTICDACHCRGCGELKENCICNVDPEWDPSWSTKATDPVYCIHCNYANDPFGDFTCDGCGLDIFE